MKTLTYHGPEESAKAVLREVTNNADYFTCDGLGCSPATIDPGTMLKIQWRKGSQLLYVCMELHQCKNCSELIDRVKGEFCHEDCRSEYIQDLWENLDLEV